jgi:hypothetical protein
MHIMRNFQSDPILTSKLFSRLFSQEITEFIKALILMPEISYSAQQFVRTARSIVSESEYDLKQNDRIAEIRVEQTLYLLSHIEDVAIQKYLNDLPQHVRTPFIERGIFLGSASGGRPQQLEAYIELLRSELQEIGLGKNNRVNLFHQLPYFGDTDALLDSDSFDIAELPISNTLQKLIAQTSSSLHFSSRILDLYTIESLVYLSTGQSEWRREIVDRLEILKRVAHAAMTSDTSSIRDCGQNLHSALDFANLSDSQIRLPSDQIRR